MSRRLCIARIVVRDNQRRARRRAQRHDRNGRIANWAIELESPVDLRRQGWTANTVSIGDVVTVEGIAARDGSSQVWSLSMSDSHRSEEMGAT